MEKQNKENFHSFCMKIGNIFKTIKVLLERYPHRLVKALFNKANLIDLFLSMLYKIYCCKCYINIYKNHSYDLIILFLEMYP